jgi:hypothetical protein
MGFLAVTVAMLCAVTSIALSTTPAPSDLEQPKQSVNRTLKGDRIAVSRRITEIKRSPQTTEIKLLHGCEGLVSPLADRKLSRSAGRCLS